MPYTYTRPSNYGQLVGKTRARDRGVCYQCGSTGNRQVDHVMPVSQGGTHTLANMAVICDRCHEVKTGCERRAGVERMSRRRPGEKHPGIA